jgi:hypothetical protein
MARSKNGLFLFLMFLTRNYAGLFGAERIDDPPGHFIFQQASPFYFWPKAVNYNSVCKIEATKPTLEHLPCLWLTLAITKDYVQ